MGTISFTLTLSLVAALASAAPADGPGVAVEVQSATARRASPSDNHVRVEVVLRNMSNKIVTAWEYWVEGRYPDGSIRRTSVMVDGVSWLLPDMLLGGESQRTGSPLAGAEGKGFRAGMVRTSLAALPLGDRGEAPVSGDS